MVAFQQLHFADNNNSATSSNRSESMKFLELSDASKLPFILEQLTKKIAKLCFDMTFFNQKITEINMFT